jgi:hypothetical protein
LNSKEDFDRKLDQILSGLGSIGEGIFPKYFWSFLYGFENKTKAKIMHKLTKRLLME